MMHLAVLAFAALPLPNSMQQPIQAEVVYRLQSRYDGRTETGVPLRLTSSQTTHVIDSIRAEDQLRRVRTPAMQIVVDAQGLATGIVERPALRSPWDTAMTQGQASRRLLIGGSAGVLFPEEQLARVFRVLSATRVRVGERWSEPIAWSAERNGVRANERGTRITTIVRDTLIDGRVHWLVRDSTSLQRQETWPEYSYSLLTDVAHARQAIGTITGQWLYDPERGIAVARADTLRLAGDVTRTFPDGRSFTARFTTARFDVWTAMSAEQFNELRVAEMAEARRRGGSMVVVPTSPVEERLARGDSAVLDSLVAAWRIADVDSQLSIQRLLYYWRGPRDEPARRLSAAALQIGDTLSALSLISSPMRSYARPFDRAHLLFMLGYLEDPARALRNGIGPDAGYDDIFYPLMNRPPVLAHDTANVCRGGVCELLERYANRDDVDPRLRDLGAIARYYQNPRDGFAALEARLASGTPYIQRVHRQALGYLYEFNQPGRGGPVPTPGADWTTWAEWRGPSGFRSSPVLKLHTLRTGRDFAREFQAGYRAAQTDTARFVFGTLLAEIDSTAFDTEQVVQLLTSPTPTLQRLGQRALYHVTRGARPAPDTLAAPLLNDLIAMLFEGTLPPWQNAGEPPRRQSANYSFLITDSLPGDVQARWRDRIKVINRAEWNARDRHLEGVGYTLRATYAGPFVTLRYDFDGRLGRAADATPYLYAGGGTIVLLRAEDGWRVVSGSSWIT